MTEFYSNGKLLLSAEYVVLDGALALALPIKFGQTLSVEPIDAKQSVWESYDADGSLWFKVSFVLSEFNFSVDEPIAIQLQKILKAARELNPNFLKGIQNYKIQTKLSFSRHWGLGSSSTLINNIAQWAHINAFELQFKCFGGSGYDIACAQHNKPILYQLKDTKPIVEEVNFNPDFKDQLYFVYLNQKQNSREGIAQYQSLKSGENKAILEISAISKNILMCKNLSDFEKFINQHEVIIGKLIKKQPVKEHLFNDYFGSIKSLGAWGGDFILATGNDDTPNYFKQKGYKTVIKYGDMVL
ncbi:MAG: GYDIA family GHMP kinase [Flavobacteriaceae bacterium]